MQNKPRRLLRNANGLGNLVAAHSLFAVHQHPQCSKPLVQSDWRILEDRSEFHAELLPALFTLPTLLAGKVIVLMLAASWTDGLAFWPTKLCHGVNTGLLVAEVPNGILECFWFRSMPKLYYFPFG